MHHKVRYAASNKNVLFQAHSSVSIPRQRHRLLNSRTTGRQVDLKTLARHFVCLTVESPQYVNDVSCWVTEHDPWPVNRSKVMVLQCYLIVSFFQVAPLDELVLPSEWLILILCVGEGRQTSGCLEHLKISGLGQNFDPNQVTSLTGRDTKCSYIF